MRWASLDGTMAVGKYRTSLLRMEERRWTRSGCPTSSKFHPKECSKLLWTRQLPCVVVALRVPFPRNRAECQSMRKLSFLLHQ